MTVSEREALLFFIIGIIMFAIGLHLLWDLVWFYRRAKQIEDAEIIKITVKKGLNRKFPNVPSYFPVFSFIDENGQPQVLEASHGTGYLTFKEGDKMKIYISRTKPNDVRFIYKGVNWLSGLGYFLGIVGLLVSCLSLPRLYKFLMYYFFYSE